MPGTRISGKVDIISAKLSGNLLMPGKSKERRDGPSISSCQCLMLHPCVLFTPDGQGKNGRGHSYRGHVRARVNFERRMSLLKLAVFPKNFSNCNCGPCPLFFGRRPWHNFRPLENIATTRCRLAVLYRSNLHSLFFLFVLSSFLRSRDASLCLSARSSFFSVFERERERERKIHIFLLAMQRLRGALRHVRPTNFSLVLYTRFSPRPCSLLRARRVCYLQEARI